MPVLENVKQNTSTLIYRIFKSYERISVLNGRYSVKCCKAYRILKDLVLVEYTYQILIEHILETYV